MITRLVVKSFGFSILLSFLMLAACSSEMNDEAMPVLPFAPLTIQLSNPQYQSLNTLGYAYVDDIGVKGVIVYKVNSSTYHAYERNCTYRPNEACAFVQADASHLFMTDACCGSSFAFEDGRPIGGPAWRSLRQYATAVDGTTLIISDDIIR